MPLFHHELAYGGNVVQINIKFYISDAAPFQKLTNLSLATIRPTFLSAIEIFTFRHVVVSLWMVKDLAIL